MLRAIIMTVLFSAASLLLSSCEKNENSKKVLVSVNFPQWQQVLEKYRGKILVVDAWATWCESCLEKFPYMVSLSEKYKDVQFLSLNLDDRNTPEDLAQAQDFIDRMDANFPHYFMNENMMDAFEKLDFFSIPVVLIYDGNGNKRHKLSGDNPNKQFTDEDIENAIIELLEEKIN